MKEKKMTPALYMAVISIIFIGAALVFTVKTSTPIYPLFHFKKIVVFNIISIVLLVAAILSAVKIKKEWCMDIFRWVAMIFAALAFGDLFCDRMGLLGFTYLSTVAAGDTLGLQAMNNAIAGWCFEILAMVFIIIGSFCKGNKVK